MRSITVARSSLSRPALGAMFAAALTARALAGFNPGDCVYATASSGYPLPGGGSGAVIWITFQPVTLHPLFTGQQITGAAGYDSYRDRAVFLQANAVNAVDSTGVVTNIPYTGTQDANLVIPTGDGRIYLARSGKISYIDAFGATHDLLNTSGSSPGRSRESIGTRTTTPPPPASSSAASTEAVTVF
jgi:hypothetical protein